MKIQVKKPIFVIGAGRSGTTILYNLLSVYPGVCWFSNLTDKFYMNNTLGLFHRVLGVPVLGKKIKKNIIKNSRSKLTLRPSEGQNIYHSYCRFEHARKTTEEDLQPDQEEKLKNKMITHLKYSGKSRFLSKQTANTQRIRLINKIFPDAYYIHIIRDGRAVAYSLYRQDWWNELDIWWLGSKPYLWEKSGKDPLELCALHWKRNVEEILENKFLFEKRYIETRYEELIEDTKPVINRLLDFVELPRSKKLNKLLPDRLPNGNLKWREESTSHQRALIEHSVGDFLKKLGYK